MISRDEAIRLLNNNIKAENMRKHCLASEVVLRAMARRLGRNEDLRKPLKIKNLPISLL
ncbi:MAG: hypothetical protein ACK5M7_13880 [Draconibacterium sp.]